MFQYLIINLGMSKNFGPVDFAHLTFPNHLRIDYVRVYQKPNAINIGCDPKSFPTADYINRFVAIVLMIMLAWQLMHD
jgi:beta-glucan synthesis-associated protein KRE6